MRNTKTPPSFTVKEWQLTCPEGECCVILKIGYTVLATNFESLTFDSPFFSMSPAKVKSLLHDLQTHLIRCERFADN